MNKYQFSNLDLFLTFIKGDHRCTKGNTEELIKRNIPGAELDIPLLRYVFSLHNRIIMLSILRQNILDQNLNAIEDFEKNRKGEMTSNVSGISLALYFESFVNQIYNIFENIAKINLFLFDEFKNQPPQKFSAQLNKIIEKEFSFNPCFDQIMENMGTWYPGAMSIRHNVNHFMTGFSVYSRDNGDEKEEWYVEYMNYDVIDRDNQNPKKILVNVKKMTLNYYDLTINSLDQMASCYIQRMDKDTLCAMTIITDNGPEIYKISYNQLISGEKGELLFPYPK